MNDDLRSAAGELETSREELRSVNEDLRAVKQELKVKIEEQARAADDIQNLINSTDIGTIFLDRGSRIQFFTPRAGDIFNLTPADQGRRLSDISSRLSGVDLQVEVSAVLDTPQPIERELQARDQRWFTVRILPYRTADDGVDGVVMTFVDITQRKLTEQASRLNAARLQSIVEGVAQFGVITLDPHGRIESWNGVAETLFGYTADEAIGQHGSLIFTPEDRAAGKDIEEMETARHQGRAQDERWYQRKDGSRIYVSGVLSAIAVYAQPGFVKVILDLTERKQWEERLQRANNELEARVEARTRELEIANEALEVELRERRETEEQVRRLLARLITVQEEERRRIARDLHDHLGQQMSALHLRLAALGQPFDDRAAFQAKFQETREYLLQLDKDLDFFTWELRPAALYDLGLSAALRDYVEQWSRHVGVAAEFHDMRPRNDRFARDVDTNLYRIAQEALNNVHKHAQAATADVLLRVRDNDIVLTIEDDGIGFDPDRTHNATAIGLIGMRERAALLGGAVEIESAPGRGTVVIARVPLSYLDAQ